MAMRAFNRPSCKALCSTGRKSCSVRVRCQSQSAAHDDSSAGTQRRTRRVILGTGMATALITVPLASKAEDNRVGEVRHTDAEWRTILGDDAFYVLRQAGTERPRSSPLDKEKRKGVFACAGCGAPLYSSETKFNSGTGWPSFFDALPGAVDETLDVSFFISRTEVRCHRCQGHLGHVFDDGPPPTGKRYCMNGLALAFQAA